MEINKYVFGVVCVICLTIIQVVAWYLGFDGQVTNFCTGLISAIIGIILGISLTKGKPTEEPTNPET